MSNSIRARYPEELLAVVPVLLGFRPEDSLIAVLLEPDTSRVICTVRIDITTDTEEVLPLLVKVASRAKAREMVLVFYTDTDLTQAALDLIANLEPSDLVVRDALLVDGDRYWSLMCEDPECCPPQGNPSPTSTSVLEAEQALCGHPTVARSREEVAARFTPRPDLAPTREDFRTAADLQRLPVQVRCDTAWECLSTLARSRPESDREVVSVVRAGLLVLIRDTLVRDYVLASVAATDTDTALALTDALVGLALTAPEGLRAVPAAAAAAVLAMTGTCPVGARELLALGEGQSLATLVESALDQALPPEQIREAFSQALLEIEHLISDDTHEVHSTSTVAGGAA